jgi:hypothetical protein
MTLQRYRSQSEHYYENALRFLQEGEVQKSAELLWGSVAEALKALAASGGRELRSHRDIWEYARELSRERNDESIFDGFRAANSLHSDFYEGGLTLADVTLTWEEKIRPVLLKLVSLLPEP